VTLINYVSGQGFQANGVYCQYSPDYGLCLDDFVYYDGTGLKPETTGVGVNKPCPSVTAVDYDGTGFKGVSKSGTCRAVE